MTLPSSEIPGYLREAVPGEFPRWEAQGYRLVVVDDLVTDPSTWRAADPPISTGKCRWMENRQQCGKPAVVELNRRAYLRSGERVDRWWGYCPEHLYGRHWVDGRLEAVRAVTDG